MKSKKPFLIAFCLAISFPLLSQEGIHTSGQSISNASYNIDIAVGQVFQLSSSSASNTVSEGVLQPFQLITGLKSERIEDQYFSAFPNPCYNQLFLRTEKVSEQIIISIRDMNGKEILQTAMNNETKKIDLSGLSSGVYYIMAFGPENQLLSSKKIIKQ
ncbi:MAG: hypothetical protein CMP59_11405 [Flavobacteriales bacterium]|nr:hypothetical protein [Flavobacteriales bacterium]|tara:strand:+ start:779 stop:1255 length:477 start_codon:yes stop_codon:yes gene_type:complete